MLDKITTDEHICGIKYWMQVYTKRIPQYEVFEYIGYQKDPTIFFFKSKSENTIISRTFEALNKNGFRPYLLEWDKIKPYYYGENE